MASKAPILTAGAIALVATLAVKYRLTAPGVTKIWTPTGATLPVTAECVVPDCSIDGGTGPVECLAKGALGLPDGGPRWRGCSVIPATLAIGSECLPSPCTVYAGHKLAKLRGGMRDVYTPKGTDAQVEYEEPVVLDRDGGVLKVFQ